MQPTFVSTLSTRILCVHRQTHTTVVYRAYPYLLFGKIIGRGDARKRFDRDRYEKLREERVAAYIFTTKRPFVQRQIFANRGKVLNDRKFNT